MFLSLGSLLQFRALLFTLVRQQLSYCDNNLVIEEGLGRGLLGKPKAKSPELMLKVDNIGQYHTMVESLVPNMVSKPLAMSIESSNVEQRSCESRKCSQ